MPVNVNRRTPWWGLVAVVATLGLLAAACSQVDEDNAANEPIAPDDDGNVMLDFVNEPEGDPSAGGRLVFGLSAETDGWDVTSSRWGTSAYTVGNAIYDPLMAYDEDFTPQPYLAESMEPNDDYTEWRINLRPGVTFHDGTAVDAEAVATNLRAHTTAALTGPAVTFIGSSEDENAPQTDSITTDGDLTVVVGMKLPWSTFPDALTSQVGYVMAPSMMEDPEEGTRNPVGSGPFVFQPPWSAGASLRTIANDNYWRDGLPYLSEVEFRVLSEAASRGNALRDGQIQAMETTDASQIIEFAGLAGEGRYQMYTDGNLETSETFIALNTSVEPFDRPLAREAIAYAVNREDLSTSAYDGLFPPAVGPFQPGSPWYVETDMPTYDPDKARELVAEYEERYGEPLTFNVNIVPDPSIQQIAETLQQQAIAVGIEPVLQSMDQTELILNAIGGTYEATGFILFGAALLDREYVFITDFPEGSPLNFTRNSNPRIVEAMNTARTTQDEAVWAEQFGIVQQEMAKDLNFIFLVHNVSAIVFLNSVHGFADTTLPDGTAGGRTLSPFLTEAWVSR